MTTPPENKISDEMEDALAAFWTVVEPVAGQLPQPVQSALQRGLDAAVEAVATRVRAPLTEALRARGLPDGADLDVLIQHERANATLAATFKLAGAEYARVRAEAWDKAIKVVESTSIGDTGAATRAQEALRSALVAGLHIAANLDRRIARPTAGTDQPREDA